jgi:hypothetical protein
MFGWSTGAIFAVASRLLSIPSEWSEAKQGHKAES